MKKIFVEIELNGLNLKNRLVRSATWEGMADDKGHIPQELYDVYDNLAKGGVGLIITGFTSVYDSDHLFGGMVRLSNDSLIDEHKKLIDIVHNENCKIITQLALGEYKELMPDELTKSDIADIEKLFVDATKRAIKAGYDGIQIHAAHFFYLSKFISPLCNHRNDEYKAGDSKILIDILKRIRSEANDIHVSIKINSDDFMPRGLSKEQSMKICKELILAGIDSIEVSGNGTSVAGIKAGVNEAYFKDFAIELAQSDNANIILVGGHRSIDNMEKILNKSNIKCLSMSRPLIREPNLLNRWRSGDKSPSKCISCNRCYNTINHKCIFN